MLTLKQKILFMTGLLMPVSYTFADCGVFSEMPEILNSTHLTIPQLAPMENSFNEYLSQLETYTQCTQLEMMALDYESESYQEAFDLYIELQKNTELSKSTAIDRYNFLIEHAADEKIEVEANAQNNNEVSQSSAPVDASGLSLEDPSLEDPNLELKLD